MTLEPSKTSVEFKVNLGHLVHKKIFCYSEDIELYHNILVDLRSSVGGWELNDLLGLLSRLSNVKVNSRLQDKLEWGESKDRAYTVKRGYDNLCSNKELIDNWPWKLIWKSRLPPKISGLVWTALHEACLTQDNLSKRKIQVENECYMCH